MSYFDRIAAKHNSPEYKNISVFGRSPGVHGESKTGFAEEISASSPDEGIWVSTPVHYIAVSKP